MDTLEKQRVYLSSDPIEFPASFVEYKLKHPLINDTSHNMECSYCPRPITPGEKYFKISVDHTFIPQIGHLTHLKSAPNREWVKDPAKTVKQPWETDPTIPVPIGWEEWKRKHPWAV